MKIALRAAVLLLCAAFALAAGVAVLHLPEPAVRPADGVASQMSSSGVTHPVTAVLLNFRGYDTLLEIAVLLLALIGVLTVRGNGHPSCPPVPPQPLLQSMARLLSPLMVLTAGYLLWAGSHQPGGAFQAGAVLAAWIVLLYLSGLLPSPPPGLLLRGAIASGFLVFLAVAAFPLATGSLLQYPRGAAGALILLIESVLTLSLGLLLAGLFLWLPGEHGEADG